MGKGWSTDDFFKQFYVINKTKPYLFWINLASLKLETLKMNLENLKEACLIFTDDSNEVVHNANL